MQDQRREQRAEIDAALFGIKSGRKASFTYADVVVAWIAVAVAFGFLGVLSALR